MSIRPTYDQTCALAESALRLMREHGIPPEPENFAVWYAYAAGSNVALKRDVDTLIAGEEAFTPSVNARLYREHVTSSVDSGQLERTAQQLEAELGNVLTALSDAGDDAARYGTTLEQAAEAMADGTSNAVGAMLARLAVATRQMQHENHSLQSRLETSTDEISLLKADLENLRHEAATDGLTGVANRRLFDEEIERAVARSVEDGAPLSLLMVDIDHFKTFNDTYGHPVGDQVLKLLAATVTACIKGRDTLARYGGEEFAVILPETALEGAMALAESIRRTVGNRQLRNRHTGESLGSIAVSIGVACLQTGEAPENLVSRADAALYQAKAAGRNRVRAAAVPLNIRNAAVRA